MLHKLIYDQLGVQTLIEHTETRQGHYIYSAYKVSIGTFMKPFPVHLPYINISRNEYSESLTEMCSAFHCSQYFRAFIHRGIVNASALVVYHYKKGNYGKTTPYKHLLFTLLSRKWSFTSSKGCRPLETGT